MMLQQKPMSTPMLGVAVLQKRQSTEHPMPDKMADGWPAELGLRVRLALMVLTAQMGWAGLVVHIRPQQGWLRLRLTMVSASPPVTCVVPLVQPALKVLPGLRVFKAFRVILV
jgi:hypothetical protein